MLIVKKFGGTSVADKQHIFNVAERIAEDYRKGCDVVIVLSAMGDTTDRLLQMAHEYNPHAGQREVDMLLSTGEQTSVALMAMALGALGIQAVSLNAFQVAMHTTDSYGKAKFKRVDTERITHELENRRIVIITGFQGINSYNDVTTLGRGGSDTTAVALAAVLGADACEIYTDVDGVYTADPRIVPGARKLKEITYDEMLEMATLGAKVLHSRSVEMAKKYGVELVVRSSMNREEGTIVKEAVGVEQMLISGVTCDKNAARIAVYGVPDRPGRAFSIFQILGKAKINVDIILQSIGRDNTKDISFVVSEEDADEAVRLLESSLTRIGANRVAVEKKVATLSVVGAGIQTTPGAAAKVFEALYGIDVNIRMISTSDIRITILVDEEDVEAAVRAVHDKFFPN